MKKPGTMLIAIAAATILAGCGGGGASNDSAGQSVDPPASDAELAADAALANEAAAAEAADIATYGGNAAAGETNGSLNGSAEGPSR